MSNPTEQPIDPDKMESWCEVCQQSVVGYANWQKHLDSESHKVNEAKFT